MPMIKVKVLGPNVKLPRYMTEGAAGCDVAAHLSEPIVLGPMERVAVPTGLALEIPVGFEVQVRPRSGFSFKEGVTVVNAPGTIDSDFRGEVKVLLVNLGQSPVTIYNGDRVAQFVLNRVERADWILSESLNESQRAGGGFGSTGKSSVESNA